VYSVVDGVLFRPLPYEEPSRLVAVGSVSPTGEWIDEDAGVQWLTPISAGNYGALRERAQSFEKLASISVALVLLADTGDGAELTTEAAISEELFEILQASPALGRTFLPEEYAAGSDADVVMITHGGWVRRYGADPEIIGRTVQQVGRSRTVVGVMQRDFRPLDAFLPGNEAPDFYAPLASDDRRLGHSGLMLYVIGRLGGGVSVERARAEAARIAADLAEELPTENRRADGSRMELGVNGLLAQTVGATGRSFRAFLAASGLLLLLATMNAAMLFFARALDRAREIDIRMALGAGRIRVTRLLLSEATVLAIAGGLVGVLIAYGSIAVFLRNAPASIPRLDAIAVDRRVFAIAAVVSLGAGVAAGLLPALGITRRRFGGGARNGAGSMSEPRSVLRQVLVGGQVAVAVVLLSSAALLFTSFVRILGVDPGFDPDGLITTQAQVEIIVRSQLGPDRALPPNPVAAAWDLLVAELGEVPGVESVAAVTNVPFQSPVWAPGVLLPGETREELHQDIAGYLISPEYLETMGIRLIQGRGFDRRDGPDAEPVALINESFARIHLRDTDPVGAIIRRIDRQDEIPMRVVGVIDDVVQARAEDGPRPAVYVPHTQFAWPIVHVVLRTARPADVIVPALRRAAAAGISPLLPLQDVMKMTDRMAATRTTPRFQAMLIGGFALAALLVAAAGLYSSLTHGVARRRRELGVRMALGADEARILRLVLRQGMVLSISGVVLGVAGAAAFTRLLGGFLYEVEPDDPTTLIAAAAVLMIVSCIACLVPARRAMRMDPATVLSEE
jgi:predicted permease